MSAAPAKRARVLIRTLGLAPHPEGGHYAEVYRSANTVTATDRGAARAAVTAIYFLLAAGEHSRWHRVLADEAWHFAEGEPLELWIAPDPGAPPERVVLGPVGPGARPVAVVPAGAWQAARPLGAYALVTCTVAPGFEFADFALLADLPDLAARLRRDAPDLAELL